MVNKAQELSKIKPIQMVNVFNKNTPLHGSRLKKEFIGLWIKASGKINDIYDALDYVTFSFNDYDNVLISANFDKPCKQELELLNKNDEIKVVGEVFNIGEKIVVLDHCRLISEIENNISQTSTNNTYNNSQIHYGTGDNINRETKSEEKIWYEKPIGILLLTIIAGVVIGAILYYLHWN